MLHTFTGVGVSVLLRTVKVNFLETWLLELLLLLASCSIDNIYLFLILGLEKNLVVLI